MEEMSPKIPEAVLGEQTRLQICSQPEWIAPTVEYLKEKAILCGACQPSRADKVHLALHEGLTNSVIHGNLEVSSDLKEEPDDAFTRAVARRAGDPAYGLRPIDIEVRYDGGGCVWVFTDRGPGFDVDAVLARIESPEENLLASGRGLLMMRAFMDEVRYEEGGRRLFLTLNKSSGQERRGQARRALYQPVRIAPIRDDGSVDWDAAYQAVSRNLSPGGISVLQSRLTTSGRVLITLEWDGQVFSLPAEVRHCEGIGAGVVELGCRFHLTEEPAPEGEGDEPSSPQREAEDAVGGLLERTRGTEMPPSERRKAPRVVYTESVEIQESSGAALVGYGRDLSRGGMAFLTTRPLTLGRVVIALPQREGSPLRVRAQVLRCNKITEGVFEAGARFLELVAQE